MSTFDKENLNNMATNPVTKNLVRTAYLAMPDYMPLVKAELKEAAVEIEHIYDRLIVTKHAPIKSYWSQNIWHDVQIESIASVNDAAKKLKSIQRNWALYPLQLHRRCALIQEKLPKYLQQPLKFMQPLHQNPLGSWSLIEHDKIIYAGRCRSPLPNGEAHFAEDRVNPPNRAYLKLWEIFTILGRSPSAQEHCLELGASPGGWTWVLAQSAGKVTAIDRSPLAENVQKLENVEFQQGNAFAKKPEDDPSVDWLCSDLICYPDKLFEFLQPWITDSKVRNFICTIKFQGEEHYNMIHKFADVPGSEIFHLSHNKHELTWVLMR